MDSIFPKFDRGEIFLMLEMQLEAIYRKIFFGSAKKRYASHCIFRSGQEIDELMFRGFEVRRSDSSQLTKTIMEKLFDMLLRQDKERDEVLRYVGDEIDRIRKGNFKFSEIGIPKGMSRDIQEYGKKQTNDYKEKGIPANIRGARYAVSQLGVDISSKPKMIYVTKMPDGYEPTDVLCFDEDSQVPPGTEVDIEKMLDRLIRKKLEPIFEALGWKMSTLDVHWKGKPAKLGEQPVLFSITDYGVKNKFSEIV